MSKLIGISFGLLFLLTAATGEARSHFNFGFGINVVNPRPVMTPCYVEDYYYPQETVVIQQDPYGRTIRETVYVAREPVRTVHVDRNYRVIPGSRSFFSLGFFR